MNSPKDKYQEKLKNALESEPIRQSYQDFVRANNLCENIKKHIFKPFIIVSSLAVLYGGMNAVGHLKNIWDFNHKPEIIELNRIQEKYGNNKVKEIANRNPDKFQPLIKEYYAKDNSSKEGMILSFGSAAAISFLTLGILGGAVINSDKKRRRLEEALNEKGISLDLFKC